MIKIKNNIPIRDDLPNFLFGLDTESLQDLSWTDASLGVQDCAWYPEEDQSPELGEFEEYGEETLTIDADRKVVVSSKAVVQISAEKISEIQAIRASELEARKQSLTQQIADLQAELASL